MAVKIVSAQAAIYEVNKEIEDVKATMHEQKKLNDDLEIQISELSKPDRVLEKAKNRGLNLDKDNVKVVGQK
ncbi:cell division protein FtsL [Bacillus sp. N9]